MSLLFGDVYEAGAIDVHDGSFEPNKERPLRKSRTSMAFFPGNCRREKDKMPFPVEI